MILNFSQNASRSPFTSTALLRGEGVGYESKRKTFYIMVSGLPVLAVLSCLRYAREGEENSVAHPCIILVPGLSLAFPDRQRQESSCFVVVVLHRLIYCSSPCSKCAPPLLLEKFVRLYRSLRILFNRASFSHVRAALHHVRPPSTLSPGSGTQPRLIAIDPAARLPHAQG